MESENSRGKNQPAVADRIAGEIASLKNPPPPIDPYKIAARQAAERLLRRLGIFGGLLLIAALTAILFNG
jgi:hypothetical protein